MKNASTNGYMTLIASIVNCAYQDKARYERYLDKKRRGIKTKAAYLQSYLCSKADYEGAINFLNSEWGEQMVEALNWNERCKREGLIGYKMEIMQ